MHDGVRQLQCCYLTLSASCCDSCTKSCCRLACMARHAGGVVWHLQSTSPDDLLKNIQRLHWGRPLNCQQFLALPLDRVVPLLVAFTFTVFYHRKGVCCFFQGLAQRGEFNRIRGTCMPENTACNDKHCYNFCTELVSYAWGTIALQVLCHR